MASFLTNWDMASYPARSALYLEQMSAISISFSGLGAVPFELELIVLDFPDEICFFRDWCLRNVAWVSSEM